MWEMVRCVGLGFGVLLAGAATLFIFFWGAGSLGWRWLVGEWPQGPEEYLGGSAVAFVASAVLAALIHAAYDIGTVLCK